MKSPTDVEKRLKALKKKLRQIEELKGKNDCHEPEVQKKLDSEQEIRNEIAALESPQDTGWLEKSDQMHGKVPVGLLAELEAVVEDVPGHAALLLGEAEQRFRVLLKSLRETIKLLKLDKRDKNQQEKLERLKEDVPHILLEFQPLRSEAMKLVSGCDMCQIEEMKKEREKHAAAQFERERVERESLERKQRGALVAATVTPAKFAADVGGVLNAGDNDTETAPVDWEMTTDSAVPGSKEAVRQLVSKFGSEHFYILSKCGRTMQDKTLTWLFKTMRFQDVGLRRKNVFFCRDRSGPNGKGSIAKGLGISHFVDDSDECLWSVYEEGDSQAAVERHRGKFFHFAWGGNKRHPPRPKAWLERPEGIVTPVRNWQEVLRELNLA